MPIYSTLTDYEIENQSIRNYGDGKLDQWLLYQGKGAEKFYNSYVATNPFYDEVEGVGAITKKDLANFAIRNLFGDKNLAFVSLGCGNSSIGEYILQAVDAKPVPHYIGVDSSMWMLEESEKNNEKLRNVLGLNMCGFFMR
ncbi:MAG: hypothetical protein GY828_07540 [Candidatus Gracilibacteria bacterium]|nr:hypothetical protein [Candidatus Gracilibacteria bacterium]